MIPQSRLSGVGMYDPPERICIDPLVTHTQIHKYTNTWLKTQIHIPTGLAAWSYNALPIRTTTLGLLVTHAQTHTHTQKLTYPETKTRKFEAQVFIDLLVTNPLSLSLPPDWHQYQWLSIAAHIDSLASNLASLQLQLRIGCFQSRQVESTIWDLVPFKVLGARTWGNSTRALEHLPHSEISNLIATIKLDISERGKCSSFKLWKDAQ